VISGFGLSLIRALDKRSQSRQVTLMPKQNHFFHFCPNRLAPKSVILPGNWGRIVRRYTYPLPDGRNLGNPWVIARELEFERIRKDQFPKRPSRMESAFCCLNLDHARAYQAQVDPAGIQVLHEVELVDPSLATHQAPLAMMDLPAGGSEFLSATAIRAVAYWTGDPNGIQEIVTASALRVIANLD
jgi:hypothetical protein